MIDESHVAVPQIHGQYEGDRSRKATLVEHGFRLPSALDNRPLTFDEFTERVGQVIFLSATPGAYELERVEPGRRAGHPADRSRRPRGGDPARPRARSTTSSSGSDHGVGRGRSGARHHPDQEDGRGPDRLPASSSVSGSATCTPTSTPSPASSCCATCGWGSTTCWSGSTCSARASTSPRSSSWPSSTPTRRASCARRRRSSRPWGARRATSTGSVVLYADTITDAMRDGHRRDPAPAGPAAGLQRRARHQPHHDPQGGDRHPGPAAPGRRLVAPAGATAATRGAGRPTADPGDCPAAPASPARRRAGAGRMPGGRRPAAPRTLLARAGGPSAPTSCAAWSVRLEQEMRTAAAELRYEEAALLRDEIAELRLALVGPTPTAPRAGEPPDPAA